MSAVNQVNFDAAIKQTWPQKKFESLLKSKHALLAKMPKDPTFYGGAANYTLQYGNLGGASASFGDAEAGMSGIPLVRFTYSRVKDYSTVAVDGETLSTAVKPDAVVDALDTAIKSSFDTCHSRTARAVYGSGNGQIGVILAGSSVATATFTLSDVNDVVNFWPNQRLNAIDPAGPTLRTGFVTVLSVNRISGTVTVSQATLPTGIPAIAAGDLICMAGDFNARVVGLNGWLNPTGTATPGTLFTVDRNTDPVLLAGNYYDARATTIEDGLIKLSQMIGRYGGRVTDTFMNDADLVELAYSLGSRVRLDQEADQNWGIKSAQIVTAGGVFTVHGDAYCPSGYAYALQMDTWKLRSAGMFPRFLNHAGTDKIQLDVSADAVRTRLGGYLQVLCEAPAYNGVLRIR